MTGTNNQFICDSYSCNMISYTTSLTVYGETKDVKRVGCVSAFTCQICQVCLVFLAFPDLLSLI
ncbi:hypothetical protein NQ317_007026 [Molorchus minor]|uniref:Uncharacterized protein n=1 Tax=Molorchus minor TaxID=1323400 RepID=A0ABQ9JT81_9CUCU|nr:hypothetical protein NQ317_007026 [Molorchus minor]